MNKSKYKQVAILLSEWIPLQSNENCISCSSKFHGSKFVIRVYKLYFYNIENEDIFSHSEEPLDNGIRSFIENEDIDRLKFN